MLALQWVLSEPGGQAAQITYVITTYTPCCFLVKQAQALAHWDSVAQPSLETVFPSRVLETESPPNLFLEIQSF